jgi:hypothetical protein
MKRDDVIGGAMLLVMILAIGAFFLFAKQAPELAYGPVEATGTSVQFDSSISDEAVKFTVTTVRTGYITVHESIGGAPGPIIGVSSLLPVASTALVTIDLTKPMTPSMPYIALMHVDNGDGTFVIADDMPVTNNGASVRADFTSPGLK